MFLSVSGAACPLVDSSSTSFSGSLIRKRGLVPTGFSMTCLRVSCFPKSDWTHLSCVAPGSPVLGRGLATPGGDVPSSWVC